jgi:hypothetical protein
VRLAKKIDGAIARDCGDPSAEMISLTQRSDPRHGLNENVLHKVLDRNRRNAGQQNAVNHSRVSLVEITKRGAITGLRGVDEILVRRIARNGWIHGSAIRERELQVEGRCHGVAISLLKQLPCYRRGNAAKC